MWHINYLSVTNTSMKFCGNLQKDILDVQKHSAPAFEFAVFGLVSPICLPTFLFTLAH